MGSKCKDCKEWEKTFYWSHITQKHFFKALLGDFEHHLSIPTKFVSNFKEELSDTVFMRGPSGNIWRVGVQRENNTLDFKDGWQAFIQDHCLQETDSLFFTYVGDFTFDVLMFDLSFCEKESSYFVKSHGVSSESKCECKGEYEEVNDSMGIPKDRQQTQNQCPESLQSEGNVTNELQFATDINIQGDNDTDSLNKNNFDLWEGNRKNGIDSFHTAMIGIKDMTSKCDTDSDDSDSNGSPRNALPLYIDQTLKYPFNFISRRRPVTKEEKDRALKDARAVKFSEPGFIKVMRASHVYKQFRMKLPATWSKQYLPDKSQDVVLRVSAASSAKKMWIVRLCNIKNRATLVKERCTFITDNNLEGGDVCLFQLRQKEQGNHLDITLMDVSIFLVVDQVVPWTKLVVSRPYADHKEKYDGFELGSKRQQPIRPSPSLYGASAGSYVGHPAPCPVVKGRFTGELFCMLGCPLQVELALQKDRQNMGWRYIEVYRSRRLDYYNAVANEMLGVPCASRRQGVKRARSYDDGKDEKEHSRVLRLTGLPYSAAKDDILDLFEDFKLTKESIHIVTSLDGRPSGEAFVEFSRTKDSMAAIMMDRMTFGNPCIKLFPSSHEEMDKEVSRWR